MMASVFLDTNIVIDLATKRKDVEEIKKLFILIKCGQIRAHISSSQVTDIHYILTSRSYKIDKTAVEAFLKNLLSFVDVFPLSKSEIFESLDLHPKDFEDACVFQCAKNARAEYLITSNTNDFISFDIQCGTVHDFFQWAMDNKGFDCSIVDDVD